MPSFNIVKSNEPENSFRVASVLGKFDLQSKAIKETFKGNIELPDSKEWQIGLIVGASGTGKTTIAKELFSEHYITSFEYTAKSIVDDMPKHCSIDEITKTFNAVGFSSPPSWLKPYDVLSNGEKMRVDLANSLLSENNIVVFDEFTSVVDRQVAKIGSFATQKAIRRTQGEKRKQFIAVTCHYDVEAWLMPDWVFDTNTMTYYHKRRYLQRPRLTAKIHQIDKQNKTKYWNMFSRYHYLSHSHNNAAYVYVLEIDGNICGFTSVISFPHPHMKKAWRAHRTVILPEYQGLSLGHFLSTAIAKRYVSEGKRFLSTTTSPSFVFSRAKDPNWRLTRKGRTSTGSTNGVVHNSNVKGSTSSSRITTSWEYVNNH